MCQYIGVSCINKPESLFENYGCEDAVVVLANIHTCTSTMCHSCCASVLIVLALVMFSVICQEENYCSTDRSSISG